MPFFVIYDSTTGSISARISTPNSEHATAAGSAIVVTTSEYFSMPEKWALVISQSVMFAPSSGFINASTAIAGGGAAVNVGSTPWTTLPIIDPHYEPQNANITDIVTPRITVSLYHQLSIADSRSVNLKIGNTTNPLLSTSFSSFNDTRLFSASILTSVRSTIGVDPSGKLYAGIALITAIGSIAAGANVTVSSRMMEIRDSRL